MEVNEEQNSELPKLSAKTKAAKPSLAGPPDISEGKRKKRAAEESEDEPKRKRKKKPVETDEVTSKIKGLKIEKATLGEKGKTEGKTTATNGLASALIKCKGPSSTLPSSHLTLPTAESARKPKKKKGEERANGSAEASLPSASVTTLPTKGEPAGKPGKKAKSKTAQVDGLEAAQTKKRKGEKKDTRKETEASVVPAPTPPGPALQARENGAKPLKSAIKSSSPPGAIKVKKRISFDLKNEEGRGKKIGGKRSSKERLVGRGPRNA
jgi:hypothetical protein